MDLVKQVKEWRESNLNTFEAEAGWYGLACNDSNFARLTGFLSKCCAYDEDHEILILEVPPESEDLDRFHRRIGRFPTETAHLVGETLGAFHTALPDSAREQLRPSFHEETPWVLSLHERAAESFESLSPANSELLRIVQKYPGFGEALDNLREAWPRDTLINGDMKFAHCILLGGQLNFIDWEMADFGDPYWDAGAILKEYVHAWIRSMPSAPGMSIEEGVEQARYPLATIQPAIRAFWHSYSARMQIDESTAEETLGRTVAYAAAQMIQTAYQSLQDAKQMSAHSIRLLQLSLNILSAPTQAAHDLLGL